MIQQLLPLVVVSLLIFRSLAAAQSPAAAPVVAAAPAPGAGGPPSVLSILNKDGRFGILIKLLQSTKVADNIDSQLLDSRNGLTVFAPTDSAFSSLKRGTLNSFTDEQKTELMQYHVLPMHVSPSQFQTASNPLRTQAGGSTELLALNVTAVGSLVNITTGETNTSVANTIYDDDQLAVYEVDKVLLPMRFYEPLPPPPPQASPPEKSAPKESPLDVAPLHNSSTNKCLSLLTALVVLVVPAFL